MFNQMDRLHFVQEMILAGLESRSGGGAGEAARRSRSGLQGHLRGNGRAAVTVRLLDPPMHEFLPTVAQLELEIAHLRHFREAVASWRRCRDAEAAQPAPAPQYESSLSKLLGAWRVRESHLEDDLIEPKGRGAEEGQAMPRSTRCSAIAACGWR